MDKLSILKVGEAGEGKKLKGKSRVVSGTQVKATVYIRETGER